MEAVRSQAVHLSKILFPDFCISNDTGNEIVSHENSSCYWINMNSRVLSSAQIRFPHPAAGLWASDSISRRESPSSVTVGRRANMDKKIVSTAPFDVFCFATLSYITDPLSSIVWVVHPLNMVNTCGTVAPSLLLWMESRSPTPNWLKKWLSGSVCRGSSLDRTSIWSL